MTAPRKRVPASAPKPQDHLKAKSAAARKAEAEDGFVVVEHCGIQLRIPIKGKTPIAAIDLYRAGDNYEGLKALLGKEQWQALSDAGMTADDLDELDKKAGEARGN